MLKKYFSFIHSIDIKCERAIYNIWLEEDTFKIKTPYDFNNNKWYKNNS